MDGVRFDSVRFGWVGWEKERDVVETGSGTQKWIERAERVLCSIDSPTLL